ncbi:baculoviral IAP repeat-containing protein 6 isoform X4 [Hydra vulgaris]|uniref:Baculoviral IAP repeat-containing protein 6 isoform X4 n=1 Tax=Hydra vulgaris TaxID=6087 RepID=A0ABM4BTT6_HYDVU
MAFAHSNRNFSSIPSTLQYIQPLNCVISSSEEIEFEIIDNHSGNKSNTSHNDYKEVIHDLTVSQNFYIPLISLWKLLLQAPLNYKHFLELRVVMLKEGILKFIINLLEDLETSKRKNSKPTEQRNPAVLTEITANNAHYWAKGTGFGTGSLTSNWDIGMTLGAKKKEEMQLMVLAAFLCDENKILHETCMIFENSCLTEVLSGFLRNDSIFDMSHHIVLYHAILKLVRSLASSTITLKLLTGVKGTGISKEKSSTIANLLLKLKTCVETYNKRLKLINNTKRTISKSRVKIYIGEENLYSETDTEELNILLYHIELTSDFVQHKANNKELSAANKSDTVIVCTSESNHAKNSEQFYLAVMSQLQFDTYEIITNKENGILQFNVPFYYESAVRSAASTNNDTSNSLRARRLAQEFATLSTSLPLSYSSTLFLRCDSERLDVIKVLITGPEDTPYENGCFEFDVYFPAEYPTSPMSINLITTGKQTIRFNPNLYNNGRVCLSILNTWSGRPEEKWNSQTSSLLQVLVSIQSLILVSEPYYNEPGYEQMRATLQGQQNSRDYNANIQQATIKWAMIEQIKNPTLCFQEIIHKHFLLKQTRVIAQCERWLAELKQKGNTQSYQSLNIHFSELKTELMKLEKNKNSGITNSM